MDWAGPRRKEQAQEQTNNIAALCHNPNKVCRHLRSSVAHTLFLSPLRVSGSNFPWISSELMSNSVRAPPKMTLSLPSPQACIPHVCIPEQTHSTCVASHHVNGLQPIRLRDLIHSAEHHPMDHWHHATQHLNPKTPRLISSDVQGLAKQQAKFTNAVDFLIVMRRPAGRTMEHSEYYV